MPSTDRDHQEETDRQAHASRVAHMLKQGERTQVDRAEVLSGSEQTDRKAHASRIAQVLGRAVEDGQIEY